MKSVVVEPLEKLLDPAPVDEFLASSWGKSFRHIRGSKGKFANLLPWDQLNQILRQHRLDFPRLRLARNGKSVPASGYLKYMGAGKRKTPIPRLQSADFTAQLRNGATLVLDAVDELYEPLENLASDLELIFHEHVQINAYAGWHTSHGFDLHWDDHDVFILQVAGRKRWAIYGMTRLFPFADDPENAPMPPKESPIWEAVLEDGDVLYIPRGWWHVATPLKEPTLHLTVGVHNRKGLDLLRWFADRMSSSVTFRQDLPRFASLEERTAYAGRMREELLEAWTADIVERYFERHDQFAEPRARMSLPWSPTEEVLPPGPDAVVRLVAPRFLDLKVADGVVEFSALRKHWRFSDRAMPILSLLNERRVCAVSEFREITKGVLDEGTIRKFLGELLLHGMIAVVRG
jgi:Cupin superfamily protein